MLPLVTIEEQIVVKAMIELMFHALNNNHVFKDLSTQGMSLYLMIFDCFCVKKCPPPKPLNPIKVHQIICNCLLMILGFGLLYQMRVNVGE